MKDTKKEYTNGEITIVWQPDKCWHSGNCYKHLPNAYKPSDRPWIKVDGATTEEFLKQLPTCPSGALSYYMNNERE